MHFPCVCFYYYICTMTARTARISNREAQIGGNGEQREPLFFLSLDPYDNNM